MKTSSRILSLGLLVGLSMMSLACPSSALAASKKRPVAKEARQSAAKFSARRSFVSKVRTVKAVQSSKQVVRLAPAESSRLSFGQIYGLHATADHLALKSSAALVVDQETHEVLFSKNSQAVLPIASLTKLMTAVVVTDAGLSLNEILTISQDDVDTEKGSHSRLRVGTQLSREEMLHLALMSSENRAAHALGRHYPGGLSGFVNAMNRKAQQLGMQDTRYVEPTGLSSNNQSSARDLAVLVNAAYDYPLIRELSTSPVHEVEIGERQLQFRNTNGLVLKSDWDIGLQKTGYITEAGRCLVMQARLAGRKLIMVFLDSAGKYSRIADAERVRKWIEESASLIPHEDDISRVIKSRF